MLSLLSTTASYTLSLVFSPTRLTLKGIINTLYILSIEIADEDAPTNFNTLKDPAWDDSTPCRSTSPHEVVSSLAPSALVVEAPGTPAASEDSESDSEAASITTIDSIFSSAVDLDTGSDTSSEVESVATVDELKAPFVPTPLLTSSTTAITSPVEPVVSKFTLLPSSAPSDPIADNEDSESEEDFAARFISFRSYRPAPRPKVFSLGMSRQDEFRRSELRFSIYEIDMARWAAHHQRVLEAEWEREQQWLQAEREYYASFGMVPYYAVEDLAFFGGEGGVGV